MAKDSNNKNLLTLENIESGYGKVKVLHNVSLKIKEGQIVTIVGANGVGKSTTIKTILGLIKPSSGQIKFKNELINSLETYKIIAKGIGYSPEGREVFGNLNVYENLRIGAYTVSKDDFTKRLEEVYQLFPRLKERKNQEASSLSGGEQQMLAIARALMQDPDLLILDEPSLGLAPIIAEEIFNRLAEINQMGTTILLIEQNVNLALHLSDHAYVMEKGKFVLDEKASILAQNDYVKKTYMGIA
ncbi:ABC transporter ATP-binding protein [Halanaerobium congolense]|jgi:branched-chain amino acid transport system ATP-binding protein|uniref:Branched-chain amino acid transport system ATP-binding protein n=1 Tax=Halanaerobium congolense TaxID=54121 RepID=A0A1G6P9K8_9FIRM|nr:ABC transporter ATP-binding protein [Halanaerobium congolense]KXS48608.1 MAG: Branched-chain amino acid transport ATP-binding protein LivF [Halanaerobium sp. T82-1]OEG63186.1 MAG: ABC transporter ATP-binding protein [Halanaerobium sp. MDAL1]PUU89546.1 MAG: Branched-chain amino acid transport ATP-binding protein LivF [Halanaerobium sp.]PTX17201.1 branched-chain amino acid transport system ATP-binding protein [Halanaerobium congolense]PXV69417.1 branched-chain amino acid transport system ATP-